MPMAGSRAAIWSGLRCKACSPISGPARWTLSSSTRSTPMSPPGMTRHEREDLRRLCRYQATLAKTGAAQRAAELRADFEEQLASIFRFDDDAIWKAVTETADAAVDEADKRIAARCNELGIPERFRPSLHLSWYSRGENASGKRRAELRKVAESHIEALEKKARY